MNLMQRRNPTGFDPFSDRRARDIRNTLSESFVKALADGNREIYRGVAGKWLADDLPAPYRSYIRDRLERYDGILPVSGRQLGTRPYATALHIWNRGLFFECHEYLETLWQRTSGDSHEALKGLIKAAGVYIHLENGNRPAARRLARRALRQIEDHGHCLGFIANLDVLLDCLQRLRSDSPHLEFVEGDNLCRQVV